MKGKSKRIVSGFLSALTIISSIMQPVTTYAAEAEPAAYEAEYPDMEKVKGALAEDEIVTAEDYEVEAGKLETWGISASTAIFSLPFQLVPVFSAWYSA